MTNQPEDFSSLRVLIAEDNATNLELCEHFLEQLGVSHIDSAGDGLEVLQKLMYGKERFDIVLMDVRMPSLDGVSTTLEILRRWPDKKNRPYIIAVTAHAFDEEVRKCLDAGMDICLSKPLRRTDLEKAFAQLDKMNPETPASSQSHRVEPDGSDLINWTQFDMVVDGPESPCVEILDSFCHKIPEQLSQMQSAAESGDNESLKAIAHQLRGAASSFGFVGFSEKMKAIELAADAGSPLEAYSAESWLTQTEQYFENHRDAVRKERNL